MKGFGIEIKNDLLDPKHIENMGISVWLYMWFIDKMTSISEEGIGLVLNGRAVKYEEVGDELGISRRTYERWIKILNDKKYINIDRVTYGLKISVNKAHKYFGKKTDVPKIVRDTPHVAHPNDKSGTSTIYNTHNNTKTIQLPIWINKNAWNAWEKYNKERRKKLTPTTIQFQIRKLEKFKSTHAEMIYQSIEKNWTGLFPISPRFGGADTQKVLKRMRQDAEHQEEREINAGDNEARRKINEDIKNFARERTL